MFLQFYIVHSGIYWFWAITARKFNIANNKHKAKQIHMRTKHNSPFFTKKSNKSTAFTIAII